MISEYMRNYRHFGFDLSVYEVDDVCEPNETQLMLKSCSFESLLRFQTKVVKRLKNRMRTLYHRLNKGVSPKRRQKFSKEIKKLRKLVKRYDIKSHMRRLRTKLAVVCP